jgi:hypothetical protein
VSVRSPVPTPTLRRPSTRLTRLFHDALIALFRFERRIDPYFRSAFDRALQAPLAALVQAAINARRANLHLGIAEERLLEDEEEITRAIIDQMAAFMRREYAHKRAERAGNTKTYGVVRGQFRVLPGLPPQLRYGIFAAEATYPAWIRFGGPGPFAPPDLDDNGVLSIGVKLMGVPGDKLFEDERFTQDFTGISAPTFTTPNIVENLKLQRRIFDGTPLFYFLGPRDPHLLDGLMQGLYSKTHANPLDVPYYSCVPYLLGEGQAMQYSIRPQAPGTAKMPKHFSDDYLREAMVDTLRRERVEFDFLVQVQTDPHRMPIEDASVQWPERLSPYLPVARLRVPIQEFASEEQLAFADNLSFNPWHSLPDHRPLGNQNRARRSIYLELSKLRQEMNGSERIEPTGDEVFG